MPLSHPDQQILFTLVRESIRAHLLGEPSPSAPSGGVFDEPRGVFVTLRSGDGSLRGCIGHPRARMPLGESVRSLAVSAAFHDRRFPPLTLSELGPLRLEISVLSPLSEADPEAVVVGKHGLLIQLGHCSGLLLPQVASERGWSPTQFLQNTCAKAGLGRDAWKEPSATIYWFTVDCYEEHERPAA